MADTEALARAAVEHAGHPISLALIDLALSTDPVTFVRAVRESSPVPLPVVVFAGTVGSAANVPALAGMQVGYINEHAGTPLILPALAPHLFPDNFNRRMSARMVIGVPVTYRSGDTLAGAVTLDVGKGGLAIRTMNPLPKGHQFRCGSSCPECPRKSTPPARWRGAIARSGWACSSNACPRTISASSTSSSTNTPDAGVLSALSAVSGCWPSRSVTRPCRRGRPSRASRHPARPAPRRRA